MSDLDTMLSRAKRAEILKLENEQLRAKADQLAEEATNLRALHQADRRRIAELEAELEKCSRNRAPLKW